jgi:streptogrisin B
MRGRLGRLLVAAVGTVTFGLFALPAAASAAPPFSPGVLATVHNAVAQSGVEGISWYTDAVAGRVVVTADSSVSSAQLATLKRAAGAHGAALQINRTSGVFTPLL